MKEKNRSGRRKEESVNGDMRARKWGGKRKYENWKKETKEG